MRRLTLLALVAACAQTGAPPGGPPDDDPPRIVRIRPDTNALNVRAGAVSLQFDEVISERPSGASGLSGLFLISPSIGDPVVGWHRTRLDVKPRGGFRNNTTYTVTMLPGLTDLDNNVDSVGVMIVFSTGPTIAQGRITGTLFDWVGDKTAPRGLVEAISLPDSTHYVASADSLGDFVLGHLPSGRFLLRGLIDQNKNRLVDPRELYDTATVTLTDSLHRELYAFVHDTLGPSIATVTIRDSLTIKLTFDRALDTNLVITPELFALRRGDSTAKTPSDRINLPAPGEGDPRIVYAMTQRMFDRRAADSMRVKQLEDSVRAAAVADSARRVDSARVNARIERPPARRAATPAARDSAASDTVQRVARKLTIQIPTMDVLLILDKPLPPSSVFRVRAIGMRSLLGRERTSERLFRTAKPKEEADSTKKKATDTIKPPVRPDTNKRSPGGRDADIRELARLLGTTRSR
ncbi:MAG: Ig-like domain-containing protein [Gemmatimonadaceae bacterium]